MANPNPNPETRFQPGQSGNPGGKPVAARNRLQGQFLNALANDFEQHGREVIARMREETPVGYIRVIASLVPKELEVGSRFEEFSDEQLDAAILTIRAVLEATQEEH